MSAHNDYGLAETLYLFNPSSPERDEEKRKSVLNEIAFGKHVLDFLRDGAVRAKYPGEEGLKELCEKLNLDQYAVPIFRSRGLGIAMSVS